MSPSAHHSSCPERCSGSVHFHFHRNHNHRNFHFHRHLSHCPAPHTDHRNARYSVQTVPLRIHSGVPNMVREALRKAPQRLHPHMAERRRFRYRRAGFLKAAIPGRKGRVQRRSISVHPSSLSRVLKLPSSSYPGFQQEYMEPSDSSTGNKQKQKLLS